VPELTLGHVVVPTAAVRDEGTSYHYLPPSREVAPSDDAVRAILAVLERHGVPFVAGRTWTTDGFYRETRECVARRVAEGCLTVEMEAAALFAVARFSGVSFGQVPYAGDDLSGEVWDSRGWDIHTAGRELLFRAAAEAVLTPLSRPAVEGCGTPGNQNAQRNRRSLADPSSEMQAPRATRHASTAGPVGSRGPSGQDEE